jgi:hypothetical protein
VINNNGNGLIEGGRHGITAEAAKQLCSPKRHESAQRHYPGR